MGWLVLAVAAVLLTAAAAAAMLRLRSASAFALAVYLFASAEIVLLTEVLSFGELVGAAGYAVGEAILLAAAVGAWHVAGRPRPPLARIDVRRGARAHPVVAALGAVLTGAFVYQAFLVFSTPPNNWDSMTYHLPRAAEWLQRGAVEYIESPTTERQNAFQPNSEIEILYTFAFADGDVAAAATQLVAWLALLVAVYGTARRLGFARAPSAFAAFLTGTLTEIALQSVTTQNDLLAASFVLAAACLALGRDRTELTLAGLAVGLALGTKLTVGAALPLIAALALSRAPALRRLALLGAASAAAFVLVGAYGYVLNLAETGRILGDESAQGNADPEIVTAGGTVSTVARLAFRFVDLSGYHPPDGVTSFLGERGRNVFDAFGIDANPREATSTKFDFAVNERVSEDISFFGPLAFLLLPVVAVAYLVRGARRRAPPATIVLALAVPVYLVAIALTFRYNIWIGRFFIAPVALTMPLVAIVYRRRAVAAVVALVGALTLGLAHAYNEAKPTGLDHDAVWTLSRAEAQSLVRLEMQQVIDGVEGIVPSDGRLGIVLDGDDWTYPLYGRSLDRRLVPLSRVHTLEDAEERDTNWVVINARAPEPPPREHWSRLEFPQSGWWILALPEELG